MLNRVTLLGAINDEEAQKTGLVSEHAYAVLDVKEVLGVQLLLVHFEGNISLPMCLLLENLDVRYTNRVKISSSANCVPDCISASLSLFLPTSNTWKVGALVAVDVSFGEDALRVR